MVFPGALHTSARRGRGARQALTWPSSAGTRGRGEDPTSSQLVLHTLQTEKMQEFVFTKPWKSRSMSFIEEKLLCVRPFLGGTQLNSTVWASGVMRVTMSSVTLGTRPCPPPSSVRGQQGGCRRAAGFLRGHGKERPGEERLLLLSVFILAAVTGLAVCFENV